MSIAKKTRLRWQTAVLLGSAAVAAITAHFYGGSEFALTLLVAAMVCVCLLYQAFLGYRSDWTRYNQWILRIVAAGTGAWLFLTTPGKDARIAAIVLYAAFYAICEWIVWRRTATGQTFTA